MQKKRFVHHLLSLPNYASENVPWLIEVYSEGYDDVSFMHDFESQGMFVINSEIIPVTYERGLFVLRLDPKTGTNETRVSIAKVLL